MSRYLPLICLALAHMLVDTCAQLIEPLWPGLKSAYGLIGVGALSVAFVVQSMPTSLSQAVFGYVRDQRSTPWLLWVGPVLGVVCMTAIGLAPNTVGLGVLLLVGGIGIGAFHPEAAVAAGRTLPEHRTRALSVFMLGGAIGLGLGPTISGAIVEYRGLAGLIYLAPPMLVLVFALWWIGRLRQLSPPAPDAESRPTFSGSFEGRGLLALAILLVCSLRLVPNMAMAKVLSFALARQGYNELEIGLYQSLFLAAASAGMFVMAFRFRSGSERRFMIWCPLAGIPLLAVLALDGLPPWLFATTVAITGLVLWGTTPAMVSYAQQQFPRGAGMASAITMGLSWGLGGLIHTPITAWFSGTELPQTAFYGFIPCLVLSAAGAWLLPASSEAPVNPPVRIVPPELEPQAEPAEG